MDKQMLQRILVRILRQVIEENFVLMEYIQVRHPIKRGKFLNTLTLETIANNIDSESKKITYHLNIYKKLEHSNSNDRFFFRSLLPLKSIP